MITNNGNKYLSGNGYMGIRGTLQEYEKEHFPAINLAGIYDQVGDGWREPLNAPNPLYTYITVDNITYRLPEVKEKEHDLSLDYRYGILKRKTEWQSEKGKIIVNAERFVSMVEKHLIAMDYSVQVDYDCQITITTGIDGDVWDINGPHYDEIKFEQGNEFNTNNYHMATAITHESKDKVCVIDTVEFHDEMTVEVVKKDLKYLRNITFQQKQIKNIIYINTAVFILAKIVKVLRRML